MEIQKINDTTWYIEDVFVRFFVLAGTERAVLIDSGVSAVDARETAEKLTGLPVFLLNTHGDGDHLAGTGAFEEIRMTETDYQNCHVADRFPHTKLHAVQEGDRIDLGGRVLEILEVPGHTKGSIVILDSETRTLIAGDTIQSGCIYMFGAHRAPEAYAGSLEKLIGLQDRYDRILSSHGKVLLDADYAEKVLDAWQKVLAGEAAYREEELHGMQVKTYETTWCGFYLQ